MLMDKSYTIKGCDDAELGIKRKSKLEYRLSYDDEKELQGIFFIIGGFGSSADIRMLDFTRKKFASSLPLMVVNVFYHCFCCRKSNEEKYSAEFAIGKNDVENLKKLLMKIGVPYDPKIEAFRYYEYLHNVVAAHKEKGSFPKTQKILGLTNTIIPPNGDYQNYLLMPALDHILVLKDINRRFSKLKIRGGGGG